MDRLRRLRINSGLTQQQLADVLGISQSLLGKIEQGMRHAPSNMNQKLYALEQLFAKQKRKKGMLHVDEIIPTKEFRDSIMKTIGSNQIKLTNADHRMKALIERLQTNELAITMSEEERKSIVKTDPQQAKFLETRIFRLERRRETLQDQMSRLVYNYLLKNMISIFHINYASFLEDISSGSSKNKKGGKGKIQSGEMISIDLIARKMLGAK